MTAIAQALRSGHSTQNILRYLSQQNPELAQTISTALEAGHSIDHVVNFISRNEKKLGKLIPDKTQRDNPFKKIQTSIHPSLKGAAKAAAMTAGAVGGGMALARAVPSILQRGSVANAAQAASSVPTPSGSPQSPLPTNQNRMQSNNASTNPQSPPLSQQPPNKPISLLNSTQEELNAQPPHPRFQGLENPDAASITEPANIQQPKVNSSIVDKLWSGFEKGRDKGFDFESDAFLKVAKRMKSTGEIRSREDFEKFFNLFDAKKNEGKDLPTALKEASIEYDNQKLTPNEQAAPIEAQEQQAMEPPSAQLDEAKEVERPKIEKNSVVSSPDGVGEVREIRGDKALVEIDGKLKKVDVGDLEEEPEDLEEAVRHIMDSTPENMKSTAMESSIHVSLPTGQDLMLVKFYDGKWAWYLDVPESLYSDIATGIYEPKTAAKTGIAQYKPGVIDSRGAGFQSEIIQNAKYAKKEKDKTWGYASTKYNALAKIQGVLNKLSKERYDEQGNIIQPKKRKKRD